MSDKHDAEIKINLRGPFDVAEHKLGLTDGQDGELYFLDDVTPGLPEPLPLLHNGIVLRIRSRGDKGDVTVKLRPCRRSQLSTHWLHLIAAEDDDADVEYKVQQDWSGSRHSLAISATTKVSAETIAKAIDHGRASGLFVLEQLELLTDGGAISVNPAQLTVLGPIKITRWKQIPFEGFSLSAERWRLDQRDLLELSIVSDLDQAESDQARFLQAVSQAGLTVRAKRENKTEVFMAALAERLGRSA